MAGTLNVPSAATVTGVDVYPAAVTSGTRSATLVPASSVVGSVVRVPSFGQYVVLNPLATVRVVAAPLHCPEAQTRPAPHGVPSERLLPESMQGCAAEQLVLPAWQTLAGVQAAPLMQGASR